MVQNSILRVFHTTLTNRKTVYEAITTVDHWLLGLGKEGSTTLRHLLCFNSNMGKKYSSEPEVHPKGNLNNLHLLQPWNDIKRIMLKTFLDLVATFYVCP